MINEVSRGFQKGVFELRLNMQGRLPGRGDMAIENNVDLGI